MEERFERATHDPENKKFKESVSVSLALSAIIVAVMYFLPKPVKEENLAEKKSGYYRVTRSEVAVAQAPAPAAAASPAVETVDQVVEKEARAAPKQPQQVAKAVAKTPEPPKPNQQTVQVQSALSNLLNRSLAKNLPTSDRGRKVMEAAIVPASAGASGLKQEISGQSAGGAVNTSALTSALKQGTGGAAAGLKGFKGAVGAGLAAGFGNGPPSMDVGMGDSDAETSGGLDKSVIAAIVREHLGQIKHCYERQLLVDASIFGKVIANWTINGDGIVDATNVKKSTMGNVAVENCVLSKIKTWKFPKPRGGGKVIVSYPFLFKSVN
jgi:outer membrane biosynthesis protein TonB